MNKIKKLVDYCLNCPVKPCKKGCPLRNDIPSFVKLAKEGNFLEAFSEAQVDGALAASVFHKNILNIEELKNWLISQGVEMRKAYGVKNA